MSNLTRQPHEISLWDDVLTAVDSDGKEYDGFIDIDEFGEDKTIIAQYYKEKKICTISSDKLNSPIYAIEPSLTRKTDGTSTLTFSIYGKYLDEETNELRDNPFIQYLTNERKVKLKYYPGGKLKWLDLVIKKIDESSENYKFTYTATDLFINELSKSGYGLEFDMELENNQGTVKELAEKVLDGSDWSVGADSELLQQTTTEVLYKIKLTRDVVAHDIFDEGNNTPIAEGEIIYAFYSSVINESYDYFQFIYSQDNKYQQDENGVVYGCGNYYIEFNKNNKPFDECEYFNEFRGERYVRSPKVVYEDVLGKYVNVYNNDEVRGYTESRYISPALITNFITNGSHIIKDTGWNKRDPESLSAKMIPSFEDNKEYNVSREFMLEVVPKSEDDFVVNSGFVDNAGKIGKIAKEDAFIFRIKGGFREENGELSLGRNQYFKIEVASYKFDENGMIERLDEAPILIGLTNIMDNQGYYYASSLLPTRAVSNKELLDFTQKRFGIFISVPNNTKTYYIKEVELFLCLRDTSGNIMLPDGKLLNDLSNEVVDEPVGSYVETTYHYYNTNPLAKDASELTYIYSGKQDLSNYRPDYVAQFEKIRGITAKETNRFNLLQSLSETFECWCRFDVWHKKTGEIALGRDVAQIYYNAGSPSYNPELEIVGGGPLSMEELAIIANGIQTAEDNYKQQKFVSFHKTIGQKKDIGFVYGINLKSIARTLESNDIATKLIVKSNNNKYANSGSCNIARAVNNPSGQNFVLDFSHYIKRGLLSYGNVQNDLYSPTSDRGWIGLFYNLKNLSKERDELIAKQSSLMVEQTRSRSEAGSSATLLTAAENEWREQIEYFEKLTGYKYGDLGVEGTRKEIEEQGWLKDAEVNATLTNIEHLKLEIEKYESVKKAAEAADKSVEGELTEIQISLDEISNKTNNLLTAFEKKYSRFLQEASWISEDYTDDNLYYFDAETTLHNAAQPKVSYSINIVELSQIEGYENYSFDLGDISYVQDPEFFGWEYVDKVKTPVKEEVVITETVTNFNSPEKNTIKAKNYRDSFEDLFQRMAASSQQLQFHSGAYDRAADAVNTDGSIMPQALSDAFAHNAYVLSNVANQSVKWDEYGITTTDTTNPAEIVRVTSGGIYLTEDGGRNWTTGISANGINAKTVTTGQLNTGAITIMNKDQTAFRWDSKGINAFKEEEEDGKRKRVNGTYVRFDEYGVYGIDGQVDFDPKEKSANRKTGIGKINEKAKFALTWDGFILNSNDKTDNTSTVRISDKDDFQILNKDGEERLKIGRLEGYNSVGMMIKAKNSDNEVVIGDTGFVDTSSEDHGRLVFKAGPSPKIDEYGNQIDDSAFRVYEDGYFYAKNGQVGGALTPAQLRDIKIETSYLNKVGGSVMCLSCYPTIVQDEINSVEWQVGEIAYSDPVLEIDYEMALEMLESVNGAINNEDEDTVSTLQVTAVAQVSKFEFAGEEEDTPEEIARPFEISLENIFKTVTEYVNSESATVTPEVGWSTEVPEMVPGLYVWTRFTNVYVVPRKGNSDVRYEVSYYAKDGSGQFTSIVFKRTEDRGTPDIPEGGTYTDPIPEGWTDGISPEGGPFVWSSQAVFKPGQDGAIWSTPVLMRDVSGKFDVQYSNEAEQPPNPTEDSEKWYDATLTSEDLTDAIWMATRSSDDDGQTWTSWVITKIKGEDGSPAQDLNLKADSYVFIQDKDGKVKNEQITFTAAAYNLTGGSLKWTGTDHDEDFNNNTATLTYSADLYKEGNEHTVTVTYKDHEGYSFTDSITILLVKDGSDAISASLTNPTMTFTEGVNSTETTSAIVYYGSTKISYAKRGDSGWRYTVDCEGATVDEEDGVISINNPGQTKTYEAKITVYKDNDIYREQILVINCLVTESPYTIELSNDSATIGVDEKGNYNNKSLQLVTQTNVTVHKGTTDITGDCNFAWTAEGGTLSSNSGASNFFTGLSVGSTTAMATVVVTLKDSDLMIGTKTLKVATVEAGAAVTYKLNVTPNTVNLTSGGSKDVTLEVLKITGGSVNTLTSGYSIHINSDDKGAITDYSVSADTTFDLYIGSNKWDSETVSVVYDGEKGDAAKDLNLTADSYVFVRDKDGNVKNTVINLTAHSSNLTGNFQWTGASSNSNTATLYYSQVSSFPHTVTVSRDGYSDSVTILLVEDGPVGPEGESAVSVALTNPTMTFNTLNTSAQETSEAIVYYGAKKINYGYSNAENGWYYTMSESHSKVSINSSTGVITVTNPGTVNIPITLTLFKGSTSNTSTHTLYINCSAVSNGNNGSTVKTVSAYYRSANFSTPTKPTDYSSSLPSGWSNTPQDLSSTYKYQYISQCTVTDSVYGTWTNPVLFARYGSDATVNALNIYNAVTNNGQEQGCFTYTNNKLYINAEFINTGIFRVGDKDSEIFFADINNKSVEIGGWTVSNDGFTYGTLGSSNSMCLYPKGKAYTGTIANGSNKTWVMGVGTNFGITTNGDLYCSTANLGNFRVTSNSLTFDTKEQEMVGASIPQIRLFYEAKNVESGSVTLSSQALEMLTYDISDKYVPQVALSPYRLSFIRNTGTLDSPTWSRSIALEPVWGTNQANDKLYIGSFAYFGANGTVYLGNQNDAYNLRVFKSAINFYYKNTNGSYANAGMLSTTNATINNQSVYVVKGDGKFYLQGTGSTSNAYLYVGNYGQIINSSGSPVATSDERAKRDIQSLTEKYEQLYDAIIPRLYRFKDGTSGRLHSGYIVQEVLSAMEKASIPTSDFAAVCAIDGPENEENLWGLRYEEFISLNTWQIQKLKSRTVIAEREIEQLKLQVQSLTEKLENLKSS